MARHIRIQYAGAAYHVMARGNQGGAIYADDLDRRTWMETLAEACEKTGWRVHAYVLMGNHYHLLLETPEANLVAGMKWLQGTYTQRYNSPHEVFGHLFQGRYKALLVDEAEGNYFEVVSTYIHLNPARAKLIRVGQEGLERYRWSLLKLGLATLGVTAARLAETAKGRPQKQALAWWLRKRTTMGRRWVSDRLWREQSAVTRACRALTGANKSAGASPKRQLEKALSLSNAKG